MSQVTSGIYKILSIPVFYELFQRLMGAHKSRKIFVKNFIEDNDVRTILDIGCGPASLLEYINDVEYYGFDISKSYIDSAKKKYGNKGHFFAKKLSLEDLNELPKFDLVIMQGVLHHIDRNTAINLLKVAKNTLNENGRLVATDPCLEKGQNPVAKYLIKHDRGRNIKNKKGYYALASRVFKYVDITVYHQRWIPYTICRLVCYRNKPG